MTKLHQCNNQFYHISCHVITDQHGYGSRVVCRETRLSICAVLVIWRPASVSNISHQSSIVENPKRGQLILALLILVTTATTTSSCLLILKPVPLLAQKTLNFWPVVTFLDYFVTNLCPFCAPFTGLNCVVVPQN